MLLTSRMIVRTFLYVVVVVLGLACDAGPNSPDGEPGGGGSGTGSVLPAGGSGSGFDLPAGIHALRGTDLDVALDDLTPLDTLVGDAEILAVGESYHASGGFHKMSARVIRYAVERLGVRAILFETPWGAALPANQYLASCAGSSHEAVQSLFHVWRSLEIQSLLQWLCSWNANHPEARVSLFGFEIWQPWFDARALAGFLTSFAPADATRLMTALSTCNGVGQLAASADEYYATQWLAPSTPADHAACMGGADTLGAYFAKNRAKLTAAAGEAAYGWAELSLFTLRQNEFAFYDSAKDITEVAVQRDLGSFLTFQRLRSLAFPGQRALLVAHNGHIALRFEDILPGMFQLGSFLAMEYGAGYAPIGQVALRARVKPLVPLAPASATPYYPYGGLNEAMVPTSVERLLAGIGPQLLLAAPNSGPFTSGNKHLMGNDMDVIPAHQFRALIYAQESEEMREPVP